MLVDATVDCALRTSALASFPLCLPSTRHPHLPPLVDNSLIFTTPRLIPLAFDTQTLLLLRSYSHSLLYNVPFYILCATRCRNQRMSSPPLRGSVRLGKVPSTALIRGVCGVTNRRDAWLLNYGDGKHGNASGPYPEEGWLNRTARK